MARAPQIPFVVLFSLLVCCSTMKITIDYNQDADFYRYKTYRWIAHKPEVRSPRRIDRALLEEWIKKTVDGELAAKGYVRAQDGQPDFLVAFHMGSQDKVDVTHYGYRYGPRGRWWGHQVEVQRYKEGTLILDIIDPQAGQLLWRGSAVDAVHRPQDLDDKLNQAVHKILAQFPPQ